MDTTSTLGVKTSSKQRLDVVLTARGLFDSRAKASASVIAGEVLLGKDRERARKPGQLVADDVEVSVEGGIAFVSRGGIKMTNAEFAAVQRTRDDFRGVRHGVSSHRPWRPRKPFRVPA